MNSIPLFPATCPIVDKIGYSLENDIINMIYEIIPEQHHHMIAAHHVAFEESVEKLVDSAIDDIKTSATYPFREALDSLYSDFINLEEENNQTISELETNLAWERGTVEELREQIEQLTDQLAKI